MTEQTRQLELELDGQAEEASSGIRPTVGTLITWLPVLLLFGLFTHLALFGLDRALDEADRLRDAEADLANREQLLLESNTLLHRKLVALGDPHFRERAARARRSAAYDRPPRPLDLPLTKPR